MKRYIFILTILIIAGVLFAVTTFKKDAFKWAWYDATDETETTVYADMDSSTIKIDSTNDSGYLIIYNSDGDAVLTITSSDIVFGKNLFISGYRNTFLDTSTVNDSYGIVTTAITAYSFGLQVTFRAGVENTDGATFQINSLGALNILKKHDVALASADIEVGQLVVIKYDTTGTDNWQMVSQIAN